HTRSYGDWSSDVCSSDLLFVPGALFLLVLTLVVLLAEPAGVPAVLDVAEQLDADLVRVEPAARHGHGARVVIGVVDALPGLEGLDRKSTRLNSSHRTI